MRSTKGLTGNASTGVFVVHSGDRLIGPFNGRSPATAFAAELRRDGFHAKVEQLWTPTEARQVLEMRRG